MKTRLVDLHGGTGAVEVEDLLGSRMLPPFSAVLWCELEPGASVGRHRQQRDPELLIGVSGAGEAEVDGMPQALSSGATVLLPFGSTLALRNPGPERLVYVIVKASA